MEDRLQRISELGQLFVHSHKDKTWSCNVELFVPTKGVEFKIKSEFNHTSLSSAVSDLENKIMSAMKSVSNKVMITK